MANTPKLIFIDNTRQYIALEYDQSFLSTIYIAPTPATRLHNVETSPKTLRYKYLYF